MRHLDCQDRTDAAVADRGHTTLESGAACAAAGSAQIIVDHLDAGPAELTGAIGKPIVEP
jgi:hypothetical protein